MDGKRRILIVDDERDLALVLVDTLEARGYQVEAAYSVADGQEKIKSFDAQVALLDIRLGRDSGIDLIAALEQARPGIVCVMMTAYAAVDTAIAALHRGAYDYLPKPLDMRHLMATLERCFEKLRLESEKAAAEKTLRAQNAELLMLQHLLQNITDSMPSALVTLDRAGRVLTCNPAAEAMTGQTEEQMQGQSLWRDCPELGCYHELFEQVLRERHVVYRHKEQLTTKDGMVYQDASAFPLEANDLDGVVLRIDDVTRRVQLEEMMLQSAKMASIGGLATGMAHEINNPLGAMMQSAQMLQITLDTQQPRVRERLQACGVDPDGLARYLQERELSVYLDGIRAAGERAAKIVSDLLSFSRKSSSDVAPHDLNVLVEQTLELAATDYNLKKKYDFRDIHITREFSSDLPDVMCDGQQIQQVILNLVRNAAQAMAEEIESGDREYRSRLTLRISMAPNSQPPISNPRIRLEVEDNGPGIPEATRARLFEPFFTTKEMGEGTGLGLWLSWTIVVERHRGRIWVEPVAGGGSRFVVELPIAAQKK